MWPMMLVVMARSTSGSQECHGRILAEISRVRQNRIASARRQLPWVEAFVQWPPLSVAGDLLSSWLAVKPLEHLFRGMCILGPNKGDRDYTGQTCPVLGQLLFFFFCFLASFSSSFFAWRLRASFFLSLAFLFFFFAGEDDTEDGVLLEDDNDG